MLRDIRAFINREKLYSYILIVSILLYSFFIVFAEKEEPGVSPAMEKMRAAQAHYAEGDEAQKTLSEFFEENRGGALFVTYSFLLLFLFILLGFVLSIVLIIQLLMGKTVVRTVYQTEAFSWGIGEIVKVIILFVFASLMIGLLLGMINETLFQNEADNVFVIIHTTITDIAILYFIIYMVRVQHKSSLNTIGLNRAHTWKDIILGFSSYSIALPLLIGIIAILSIIVQLMKYEPPPHPLVDIFVVEDKENPALIYLSIVLACTVGPFVEEVFFRGFCYSAFKKRWGIKVGMIMSAAFFAIIHQSAFSFIPIFVLGLILAFLYEKRGTLIPSITLHIVHNTLFIGYFFILKRVFLDRIE